MTTTELMGQISTFSLEMITRVCPSCGIPFAFPKSYYSKLYEHHVTYYCPNGHSMYQAQKTEAEQLKEKLVERENQVIQLQTSKIQLETQMAKMAAGKCPCCGKTFKHLQKHMASVHPRITKSCKP